MFRLLLFLFTPREWEIYSYIMLRTGPEMVAWPTLQEIGWDLNFRSIPKLKAHLSALIEAGWLVHRNERGRDYYVPQDPLVVVGKLRDAGHIPEDRMQAIEELVERLGHEIPTNEPPPERVKRRKRVRVRRASTSPSLSAGAEGAVG